MQLDCFKVFLIAGIAALQTGALFDAKWPAEKVSISGEVSTNLQDLIDNEGIAGGAESAMLRFCAGGGKAVGWNSTDSCWLATCGNWDWSANYGNSSDYDVATTSGGNSWTMSCTADGDATSDPAEEVICLGVGVPYNVRMYATADIMLAWDNTCYGGSVYLPQGVYHSAGCGQSGPTSQTSNNCPWLQRDPTHEQHRIQTLGGISIIGAGSQRTDAAKHGIDLSKTMIVMDHGRGGDAGDADRGGDKSGLDRRSNTNGGGQNNRQCKTLQDTYGTLVCLNNQEVGGRIAGGAWARNGIFNGSCIVGSASCNLANPIASGVCENDPTVKCTSNDLNRSGGAGDTGDCDVVGGDCLGIADMIESKLDGGEDVFGIMSYGTCSYGDGALNVNEGDCDLSWDAVPVKIADVTGATGADPRGIAFDYTAFPIARVDFDPSYHGSYGLIIVDEEMFFHSGGGFKNIGFMQANWPGRDHDGDNAYPCVDLYDTPACPTDEQTSGDPDTKCDIGCYDKDATDLQDCAPSGEEAGCDGTDPINMGIAFEGGFEGISLQHAGGGREYSLVDGIAGAIHARLYHSEFFENVGELTDASGWDYYGNVWRDSNCGSAACIKVGFTNNFRARFERIYRLTGAAIFNTARSRGTTIRDLEIYNSITSNAIFQFRSGAGIDVSGIRGHGNIGSIFMFAPYVNSTIFNANIQDFILEGHRLYHSVGARPRAVIEFTDYNGNATYEAGRYRTINIGRFHINIGTNGGTDDPCMVFLGGGTGDDSDADNGAGRTIDDYRNEINIFDGSLHAFDSEDVWGFCLGNAAAGQNEGDERLGDEHDMVGPRPTWKNLTLGKSYGMEIDSGEVDGTDEEIDETGHGFQTGDGPFYVSKDGNGLTKETAYWAHWVSANAFSIHENVEDALADANRVNLTANTNDQLLSYHYTEKIPDWPHVTVPARDVPDCDTLSHGTVVAIYDDTTAAGTCDDSDGGADGLLDGGGSYTSICACDPAGTGTWSAVP